MGLGLGLADVRELTLGQARLLGAAALRREREAARLALFVARAAGADAEGYRAALELLGA